jgi:hypothetical protein
VPNKPRRDPSIIDDAPLAASAEEIGEDDRAYLTMIGDLSLELDSARAELEQLKAKKTVDDVRASMLEGYSNRVFWSVVSYCAAVGAMITAAGFEGRTSFELSDAILGIIAGSTAVSVIGLIGMVITGLFGGSQRAASAVARRAPAKKDA